MRSVHAGCSGTGYDRAIANLQSKLGNRNGEPSAGADLYYGASGATIYLFCPAQADANGWGASAVVALHELQHVYQQAFLQGHMISITPPTDTLGANRFVMKNYQNGCDASYATHVKGVMDALPVSMKLLSIESTHVLLIPEAVGGIGNETVVDAAIAELVPLVWPNDCAGVQFESGWYVKENNQIAEGEAQWFAESMLMATGANAHNDAHILYDGAARWAERHTANMAMMSGAPGKQTLHLPLTYGVHNQDWISLLNCLGWRNNPVGEITFNYLQSVWRPNTTHAEMQNHWITVFHSQNYESGFNVVFGQSWQQFVCEFETYYGIDRRIHTCAGVELKPPKPDNCDGHTDNGGLELWMIIAIAAAGVLVIAAVYASSRAFRADKVAKSYMAPDSSIASMNITEFAQLNIT